MDSSKHGASFSMPNAGAVGTSESLNDELARMRNDLNRQIDALRSSLKTGLRITEGRSAEGVTAQLHPSARPVAQIDVQSQVLPNGNEWVERDARFVLDTPYILTNPQYRERIAATTFSYFPDSSDVNARARSEPDGSGITRARIHLFGGLVTSCHLASTALAAYVQGRRGLAPTIDLISLNTFLRRLGQEIRDGGGHLTHASRDTLLANSIGWLAHSGGEQIHDPTQSYASAMIMSVVAHEAGHIALGHTLSLSRPANNDISRNREREADSFAASVLASSPFREYLFLGQVLVSVIFCWAQSPDREMEPTTHPCPRERFWNALRSNTSAAAEAADNLGMTSQFLEELLPDQ